eukprot:6458290-Amphidinium_carterae.2
MRQHSLEDLAQLAAHLHTYDQRNAVILGDFNLDSNGLMARSLADYLLDAHWFVANKPGEEPEPTCITPTSTSRADGMYCMHPLSLGACGGLHGLGLGDYSDPSSPYV